MSRAVSVVIPENRIDLICKAAIDHIGHEHGSEQEDSFVTKNPAAKRLKQIVSETYDAMTFSMLKEISEVFSAK